MIILDGLVKGSWKRTVKKNMVEIEIQPIVKLSKQEYSNIEMAAAKFGDFLEKEVKLLI